MDTVEIILDAKATLGEGPCWDSEANVLYWVDIVEGTLYRTDVSAGKSEVFPIGMSVSSVVPAGMEQLMLTTAEGFYSYHLKTLELTNICNPEEGLTQNRFNDGKCDPKGRYWAGSMATDGKGRKGSLYTLDRDLTCKKVLSGIGISNGISWSPDFKTMYFIDTPTKSISSFDFDIDTGSISNRIEIIDFADEKGFPDGMTSDAEGNLWIAHFGGGQVSCWDPVTKKCIQRINVPVPIVSSCTFGGRDLSVLYITTGRQYLNSDQLSQYPESGGVFQIQTQTRGQQNFKFCAGVKDGTKSNF